MFDRHVQVRMIMTDDVMSVRPDTVMTEVANILKSHSLHHIPVVENERVVGMISAADCHKLEHHFTLFKTHEAVETNAAIFRSVLARDVMQTPVATIRATDTVQFASDIFKENLFHALPVVDDYKRLVGILTPYDLMIYAYGSEVIPELPR